ncbi:MAG: molybdopterin-dependent oxidoreductase [Rhodospirillaceae bacterium]|nr:molybdopterin-dependent oxidoreductase [Rhodospirillaceae bacterium]
MAEAIDVKHIPTVTHWGAYSAEVQNGRVVKLHPFKADPDPSPIGDSIPGALTDPLRIAQPMVRQGWLKHGPRLNENARGAEPFVAVPWDEALDMVAGELKRVRDTHGNASIFAGSYGWASAGRFHHAQSQLKRFMNTIGGFAYSVNSYSIAAGEVLVNHVMGGLRAFWAWTPTWDIIAEHSELVVAFGGLSLKNAQVEGGGMGRHVAREGQLKCRDRGVQFVSISAVRDDTADFLNADWLTPRPGSDVALMFALAHTLIAENLHNEDFLHRYCVGWDKVRPYIMGENGHVPKTPEWAASLSGVSAETIRVLARRMAKHRTLVTISWSLQRSDHGEQTYWAAITLAAVLGQYGLPGGGIGFGYGAINGMGAGGSRIAPPTLPMGTNPIKAFIPVARISDMLEHPGQAFDYNGQNLTYPDVRLVYWCGGNPFHHHQDLGRLVRVWQRPETVIVHEPWWNPLARHADIVLPVTTPLERNDIAGTNLDSYALAMHQVIAPVGQARNDHDIFCALADRMNARDAFSEGRDEKAWLQHLYSIWRERAAAAGSTLPEFEAFWDTGSAEFPDRTLGQIFLARFRAEPEVYKLRTPSGKIEIYSDTIASYKYDDCPGHAVWFEPAEWLGAAKAKTYPLHLISNQPRTRLHSQYDNGSHSQASKVQGREPAWINPVDATVRGIKDGDVVRLFNDRGACLAGAVVTDGVMAGVVQLATGAWYSPADANVGHNYPTCVHGNPNVLTRDAGTSKLAQGSAAQTCLVQMEKFEGPLPPVTAFTPPRIMQK